MIEFGQLVAHDQLLAISATRRVAINLRMVVAFEDCIELDVNLFRGSQTRSEFWMDATSEAAGSARFGFSDTEDLADVTLMPLRSGSTIEGGRLSFSQIGAMGGGSGSDASGESYSRFDLRLMVFPHPKTSKLVIWSSWENEEVPLGHVTLDLPDAQPSGQPLW